MSTCTSEWSLYDPSRTFASADHIFIAETARGMLDGENESEPFVQTKFHPSCHPLVCTGTDTASQHQNKTTTISWAVQTHPDRSCFRYDIMAASKRLNPGECVQNAYGPKSAVGETFSWILLSFQ